MSCFRFLVVLLVCISANCENVSNLNARVPDQYSLGQNGKVDLGSNRDTIKHLQEEIAKLKDLIQVLRDQQQILRLLKEGYPVTNSDIPPIAQNIKPAQYPNRDEEKSVSSENNSKLDTKQIRQEIQSIRDLLNSQINKEIKKNHTVVEDLPEYFPTLNKSDNVQTIKKLLHSIKKPESEEFKTLDLNQTENTQSPENVMTYIDKRMIENATNVSEIVGAPRNLSHLFFHPKIIVHHLNPNPLMRTSKLNEFQFDQENITQANHTDAIQTARAAARSRSKFADLLKSLANSAEEGRDDSLELLDHSSADIISTINKLKRKLESSKTKKKNDLNRQLKKLLKNIDEEGLESKTEQEDALAVLKKLEKSLAGSQNLDKLESKDISSELENLQKAIDNLRPEENDFDDMDINLDSNPESKFIQKLLSVAVTKPKKDSVTTANLLKKLLANKNIRPNLPTMDSPYTPMEDFIMVEPQSYHLSPVYPMPPPSYSPPNPHGYPGWYYSGGPNRNMPSYTLPPYPFLHPQNYGSQPKSNPIPSINYDHSNNVMQHDANPYDVSKFYGEGHQFFRGPVEAIPSPNGYIPITSQSYNQGAPPQNPQKYPGNPLSNDQIDAAYSGQKLNEATDLYSLQNAMNSLNQPTYTEKPEDYQILNDLESQINALKGIIQNISTQPQEPTYSTTNTDNPTQNKVYSPSVDNQNNVAASPNASPYTSRSSNLKKILLRTKRSSSSEEIPDSSEILKFLLEGSENIDSRENEIPKIGPKATTQDLQQRLEHLKKQLESKLQGQKRSSMYYHPQMPYVQPYAIANYNQNYNNEEEKAPKKETPIDKIINKVIDKIVHKIKDALPKLIQTGLGLDLEKFGFGDSSGYNDGYGLKPQSQPGLFGIIPMLIVKVMTNVSYFINLLKKNSFFKSFLVPALLVLAIAGAAVFLIWWMQPSSNSYKQLSDYNSYSYYQPVQSYGYYKNSLNGDDYHEHESQIPKDPNFENRQIGHRVYNEYYRNTFPNTMYTPNNFDNDLNIRNMYSND